MNFIKKYSKRAFLIVFCILVVLITSILGIIHMRTDWQLVRDERKATKFEASQAVQAIEPSLGLTRKGRAVFYATQPTLSNNIDFLISCDGLSNDGTFTSGCYYEDDKKNEHMYVYDIPRLSLDENGISYDFYSYKKIVMLHETMHAVWNRFSEEKQELVCGDLTIVSGRIVALQEEIETYSNDHRCSELFARVGTEYIPIINPDLQKISVYQPVKYSMFDESEQEAIRALINVYAEYVDINKTELSFAYWQNEYQVNVLEAYLEKYRELIQIDESVTQMTIDAYYRYPSSFSYNIAMRQIDSHNEFIDKYNSYVNTYNSIYSELDSTKIRVGKQYVRI